MKKAVKLLGKLVSILSILFIIRAVYVLGFDFSAIENWGTFLLVILVCTIAKCITVFMSGNVWYRWLCFFSGKTGQRKEALCVYAKANIGKYLPGNVMHYVERNLFADKLGISQKKLAIGTLMEVIGLVVVAAIIAVIAAHEQLQQALYNVFGENYGSIVALAVIAGFGVMIVAFALFRKKLLNMLKDFEISKLIKNFLVNMLWYAVVLIILGALMVVLYWYMDGNITFESAKLIISGYIIAWVMGYVVPGAPGGIGVRELVITVLLGAVVGDSMVVTLSVTHRLITIIGDFMAYLVRIIIENHGEKKIG